MKYKILIPSAILGLLIAVFSFGLVKDLNGAPSSNQQEVVLKTTLAIINAGHFNPKAIDDSFSVYVFNRSIESLDPEKRFFLQSDIDQLGRHKSSIDDEILNQDLSYFEELNSLFSKRIETTEKIYKEVLSRPLNLNSNKIYEADSDKIKWAKNEDELKARWEDLITFRVLAKYYELKKDQDQKLKDSADYVAKKDDELRKEAQESISKVQERFYKRLKKLNTNDRFSIFMNAITSYYDPHTNFMQPTDRKRFEEMMSGTFIGIGASLNQLDDGKIKVAEIVTGSPAWKQGKLKKDDVIEKVGNENDSPVEVDGYDLEDVVKMIRGAEGTTVHLHVLKTDGTREVVSIVRGKVDFENVFAKSAVVDMEGKKMGYIYLPEFYSNFNGIGRKSAEDVEREVKKLMDEQVEGIVLDLRNNGGGSLSDVVDMVGIFTGSGPVVQIKGSGGKISTLRARRAEALYNGPLIVMVNNGSASASEIFAAAIQDYGRGVVVGTNSFGKGTVQKIIPLDEFVSKADREMIITQLNKEKAGADFDGVGSIKLTIQKFYRIDGGSTQIKGVRPDIALPNAFEHIEEDLGERKDKNSLPWDKIRSVEYKRFEQNNSIAGLLQRSQSRVSNSTAFSKIQLLSKQVKKRSEETQYSLNESDFFKKMKSNEALSKELDDLDSMKLNLNVVNLNADLAHVNLDETSKEKNETWLKNLKKDPYLNETTYIMLDYIGLFRPFEE